MATSGGGFSTDDQLVLTRGVEEALGQVSVEGDADLRSVFEIDRCVKWIEEKDLKAVTLQFPDSLLKFAPTVAAILQDRLGKR